MARYKIWDKQEKVITPVGEVLSPEQWIERYPVAAVLDTVVYGSAINGGFFGVYDQMIDMYTNAGCDFTGCETKQDHLDAIEAFEDASNAGSDIPSAEERIAASLEAQVMMQMADEEVV